MRKRIRGILMSGKQFSLDSHLDLVQGIVNHASTRPYSEPSGEMPLVEDKNETEETANNTEEPKQGKKDCFVCFLNLIDLFCCMQIRLMRKKKEII